MQEIPYQEGGQCNSGCHQNALVTSSPASDINNTSSHEADSGIDSVGTPGGGGGGEGDPEVQALRYPGCGAGQLATGDQAGLQAARQGAPSGQEQGA